ncbi:MAG: ribonuclease HII [Anaerolineae bacterium]
MTHQPHLAEERSLWARGYRFVAGIDEAGRGAWAGPVVAAAVVLPSGRDDLCECLSPVRDSKLLTPHMRETCYDLITASAVCYGVGCVSSAEIDCCGIAVATRRAMCLALQALSPAPEYLLIDYVRLPEVNLPQLAEPFGDRDHLSIAAASILAKVTRDRLMVDLGHTLEGYGLDHHKGYGTAEHLGALCALGVTCQHRRSFAPIRALCEPDHD